MFILKPDLHFRATYPKGVFPKRGELNKDLSSARIRGASLLFGGRRYTRGHFFDSHWHFVRNAMLGWLRVRFGYLHTKREASCDPRGSA